MANKKQDNLPPRFRTTNPVISVEERIVFKSYGKPSVVTQYKGDAPYYIDGDEVFAASAMTIDSGKFGMAIVTERTPFEDIPQCRIDALRKLAGQIHLKHMQEKAAAI